MKFFVDYDFPNWNDYINAERSNKFMAAKMKKNEHEILKYLLPNTKYEGEYPTEIIFTWHFKDKRKDLDGMRVKSLLDAIVKGEILKNDNLNCIQKIVYNSIIDGTTGVEVEIKELKK